MIRYNLLLLAICFTATVAAQEQAAPPKNSPSQKKARPAAKLPSNVRVDRDLSYGPHGERNTLDLYRPEEAAGPLPLVIWVHGGGWQNGSKASGGQALRLLEHGFAVASINYRLSGQAIFPAQIEDCKAAVRYLRANAQQYGLAHDRFGCWGSSAGGHLVALLGTSGDVPDLEGDGENRAVSSRVQAVCDWYGPTDLLQMAAQSKPGRGLNHDSPNSPESKLIGGPIQEKRAEAERANPIRYVTAGDPPFLILHGDEDPLVPYQQSELLHERLKKEGIDSTLVIVPGGGHGAGIGTPENLQRIVAFFQKHLQGK